MARKGHTKSRLGCANCKRRHQKCDESRPTCVNCRTAKLTCDYVLTGHRHPIEARPTPRRWPAAAQHADQSSDLSVSGFIQSPAKTAVTSSSDPRMAISSLASSTNMVDASSQTLHNGHDLNLKHLRLLGNFLSRTDDIVSGAMIKHSVRGRDLMLKYAYRSNHLMSLILAVTALRESLNETDAAKSANLHRLSLEMMGNGLTHLQNATRTATTTGEEACAALISTTVLSTYYLAELFTVRDNVAPDVFFERVVTAIELFSGVSTFIDRMDWDYLSNSPMKIYLALDYDEINDHPSLRKEKAQFEALYGLIEASDLTPTGKESCARSIEHLIRPFGTMSSDEVERRASLVVRFRWFAMYHAHGFTDLLRRRVPQAMIILAHWAVSLARAEKICWYIVGAAKLLISTMSELLPPEWHDWLTWPSDVVEGRELY